MDEIRYLDFDLLIERAEEGYTARVLNSPAGQASADFSLPFSELELENFLLRVGRTRRGVRRLESPEMQAAKTFGGRLFEAVFGDEVRGCLRSSLDEANRQGVGLRVRLRLAEAPELADVPWEYLYNPALNRFLVLTVETPLVRYLDLAERIRPLEVKPPLRVLVMISSPRDYPPLNVEREWAKLREALGDLEQRGLIALERLEKPTLADLQRRLRRGEYHVFHFIGHGGFDERAQDGILLLEDEEGRGRPVSGQYLGTLLHDERTLRLTILNACEGARTSRSDPFAGTAQSLVQQGIPAVIAMQFEITDEAAITLAHEFYAALADGYPVDAALAEARKAIFAQKNDVEWGTPVLYMRSPDGRIFDIEWMTEEGRKRARVAALYREAEAAMANEDWATAIGRLQTVLALDPTHAEAAASLSQARQQQREMAGKEAVLPPPPAPSGLGRWLWVGIPAALVLLLLVCGGGYLLLRSIIINPTPTPTPTQAVTLTNTPTPTLLAVTPTWTPTPTSTPTPTPTPIPTPTPTPACPAVSGPFAGIWQEAQERLGCAVNQSHTAKMAEEHFEHGRMFWREDTDLVSVLYSDGRWEPHQDIWREGDPEYSCPESAPMESPPTPIRGFGKIWCTYEPVRSGLGWATDQERGYYVTVQDFERGSILRTDDGTTYMLYDDRSWERR